MNGIACVNKSVEQNIYYDFFQIHDRHYWVWVVTTERRAFSKLNTSLMVITWKVGCIQTTWLVDEFLSKLMKHTCSSRSRERDWACTHLQAHSCALGCVIKICPVFWSDALFQRSPADFTSCSKHSELIPKNRSSENEIKFCEFWTKRERRLMPLNSLTGARSVWICKWVYVNPIPSNYATIGLIIQASDGGEWAENLILAAACATAFTLQTQFLRPCALPACCVFHLQLFAPHLLTQGVRAFVRPSRTLLVRAGGRRDSLSAVLLCSIEIHS